MGQTTTARGPLLAAMLALGLTMAVRSAAADDITVTLPEQELTLLGLPALSGDGTTVALPLVRLDKDSMQVRPQKACVTFVIRLAPVGKVEGEDITLPRVCGHPHVKSIFNPGKSYPDSVAPATAAREALRKPLAELTQRLRAGNYQPLPRLGMNAVLGYAIKGLMIEIRPMKPRKPTVEVRLGKKKLGSAKAWAASLLPGWDVSPEAHTAVVVRGKPEWVYAGLSWLAERDDQAKVREDAWVAIKVKPLPPLVP